MTCVLISGISGFVGHHLVSHILSHTDWEIIAIDRLESSLSQRRCSELNFERCSRIELIKGDFSDKNLVSTQKFAGKIDYVFHFGAETDINKSINNPYPFVKSNILGTFNFLEIARQQPELLYFVYVSTNEVYGYGHKGEKFGEWHAYNCLNPYSATKAAAEEISLGFSATYEIPVMILRTMNLFGERQDPRKFISSAVKSIITKSKLKIFTDATGEVGSRAYFHVNSFISAIFYLLEMAKSKPAMENINWNRDKFNIAGDEPISNLILAKQIAKILGEKLNYELFDFYSGQPAHILHSALDCSRIRKLGWAADASFNTQLENTVRWLVENPQWT